MADDKIRIDDVIGAGHCVLGARRWFNDHGLDFRDFLKNGIDKKTFVEQGDDLARQIVEHKESVDG